MSRKIDLQGNAVVQYFFGFRACTVCLAAVLMVISGCAEQKEKQASKPPVNESQSKPSVSESETVQKPPLESSDTQERAEVQETEVPLPGSGQTAWAQGFEGELIMGLDGGLYPPYSATTIMHIQSVMKNRGLYSGPLNGMRSLLKQVPRVGSRHSATLQRTRLLESVDGSHRRSIKHTV